MVFPFAWVMGEMAKKVTTIRLSVFNHALPYTHARVAHCPCSVESHAHYSTASSCAKSAGQYRRQLCKASLHPKLRGVHPARTQPSPLPACLLTSYSCTSLNAASSGFSRKSRTYWTALNTAIESCLLQEGPSRRPGMLMLPRHALQTSSHIVGCQVRC